MTKPEAVTQEAEYRPAKPAWDHSAWYLGWEAGEDDMASRYTDECWIAYKGGCDLDAPTLRAKSWDELLDLIEDEER